MKRFIAVVIMITVFISNGAFVFAEDFSKPAFSSKKIMVYVKPGITVELNGIKQAFLDSKGQAVYPVIYDRTAYLPVRAISGLMKEPIEWDKASKTIFVGKTLSNPSKEMDSATHSTSSAISQRIEDADSISGKEKVESAYLKPDVLVMYDFELQTFYDVSGGITYPIIYNGTTYLPISAISQLMSELVVWDGTANTILIGNGEKTDAGQVKEAVKPTVKYLKDMFEQEEILYYETTAKTTSLKVAASLDEKLLLAKTISNNYLTAQKLTAEIKATNLSDYTEKEKKAHERIVSFAESNEYYILVLENISYLAAQNADYSMLAETFLYFALDSQNKMEEARRSVIWALN